MRFGDIENEHNRVQCAFIHEVTLIIFIYQLSHNMQNYCALLQLHHK